MAGAQLGNKLALLILKTYLSEISYLLGEDKKKLPFLLLLFFGGSILELAGLGLIAPYVGLVMDSQTLQNIYISELINKIGIDKDRDSLLIFFGFALVGVFLLKTIASIAIHGTIIRFSQNQQVRLRSYLMRSYQNISYLNYQKRNSSEYVHTIQNLASVFSHNVVMIGLKTVGDSVVAIVIFLFLAWTNIFALSLLIMLLISTVFVYDRIFRYKLKYYGVENNKALSSMLQGINEGMEGFKEIRVLNKEEYFYQKVHLGAKKSSFFHRRLSMISVSPRYFLELMMVSFIVLLVLINMQMGDDVNGLLPMISVFGVAAMRLMPIANGFSSSVTQFRYARDSISRLYRDILGLKEIYVKTVDQNSAYLNNGFSEISLKEVSFSYPNVGRKILDDITLEIKKGESVGFIGSSGSGKTTLIDIILGLLEPESGEVFYNGKPLSQVADLCCSNVAYLPQQVFLIDNTLKNNIALGVNDDEINMQNIVDALEQSRLTGVVNQLDDGIETMLGERGIRLSGGQRQRVALARAFYHKRDVLIMDEATSALDNETEQEIVNEIKRLKGKKTMIVIAHRYTTVEHCDRIYKLENGKIIASGAPAQMLGK